MYLKKWIRSAALVLTGLFLFSVTGGASEFPKRPIILIAPYPAGGASDGAIRHLAEAAKKYLSQPVIVENRAGGAGAVGLGNIIGKDPDGYLLCGVTTSTNRAAHMHKLSFDTVKDVTPIIRIAGYLNGICVRSDSPFSTLKDLIQYAKGNPGKINYMTSGFGTGGHIAMEKLAHNAGDIKPNHIPTKGDQECSTGLLGGHCDAISTTSGWIPLVEAGKLKLLVTYGKRGLKNFHIPQQSKSWDTMWSKRVRSASLDLGGCQRRS